MIPLPPAKEVADLLTALISQSVTIKSVAPKPWHPTALAVAAYQGTSQDLEVVVACDFAVGASLGAALVVMPPARVDECTRHGRLDDLIAENLAEVFNVLSAVFPRNGAPRMVLRAMNHRGPVPDDVTAMMTAPRRRLDLEVTVTGYRSGRLSIVTA